MSRDPAYLFDILDSARLALAYVADKSREEFLQDVQLQDAVIRRLEIIGEAARRLTAATRASLPELPWRSMIGMRNVMIHQYDAVDLGRVWDTVTAALPDLIAVLEPVISAFERPAERPANDDA
jgi:uncharacterized protein with HEPN domain